MKLRLILLFISISIVEGYSQNYNQIQFDTIKRKTSARDLFFKNVIEKDNDIFEIEKVKVTAVEVFKKYKQTRHAVQNEIINNQNKVIGQLYAIERYIEKDTIFKFKNLKFNRFVIYSDNENKTIAFKLYGGVQKFDELYNFIKKYSIEDENADANNFELKDNYNLKFNNKRVFLKVTNNYTAEPSPMPINISEEITPSESSKVNDKYSPPIELIVIFNDLDIELEEYFIENNFLH